MTKAGAFWRNPLKDYRLGVNNFWIIQNNKPVVYCIKRISTKKGAVSVRIFDFSTLYTKILKEAPISNMVYVTKNGAVWRKPSGDFQMFPDDFD